MDTLMNLMQGVSVATQPINILYCLVGGVCGVLVGALPGLGPSAGLAIILPLTFGMEPVGGIIMLAGIYYGTMYGGAITAILIGVPGDSAAVATTFDGYPMNVRRHRAGAALGTSFFSSLIGGVIAVIIFTFLAPTIANFALSFGPPEYFALMILGFTTISGLTGKNPTKGYIAALIGLVFSLVGVDMVQGYPRFTFNMLNLLEGISFVPAALGLFGIAEIMSITKKDALGELKTIERKNIKWKKLLPNKEDWKHSYPVTLMGSIIGFLFGVLPGVGATIASFVSYSTAKKISKRGDEFGTGIPEGIASCESANNAASVGALIPMLTLGVPGSGATVIMMGALMMFGMNPGPLLFVERPDFVWGLVGSLYVGNLLIFLICMTTVSLFVRILKVSTPKLNAVVMAFIIVGAYCLSNNIFDIGLTLFFGIIGYFMKKLDYPRAPLVLALVLGSIFEQSLRQSMILSDGSFAIFFKRPLSATIIIISAILVLWPVLLKRFKKITQRLKLAS